METHTAPGPIINWTDEHELLERAASPPESLFPLLRSADVMWPLMACLAAFPLLWCLARAPLSDACAEWGQRGLVLVAADEFGEWFAPTTMVGSTTLNTLPPWSNWTVATLQLFPGLAPRTPLLWAAGLGIALAIYFTARIATQVGGASLALLAVVFLASSPVTFRLVQSPNLGSLSAVWVAATLWCIQQHLSLKGRLISWPWLGALLSFALCFLSGGPLGIVVAVLIAAQFLRPGEAEAPRRIVIPGRTPPAQATRPWRSGILLLILGICAGGWWIVILASLAGPAFWKTWWSLLPLPWGDAPPVTTVTHWESLKNVYRELVWHQPFAMGFVFLGIGRAWSAWHTRGLPASVRRGWGLLVTWGGTAFVLWLGAQLRLTEASYDRRELWSAMMNLPLGIFAGVGVVAIVDRQVSFRTAFAACLISAIIGIWRVRGGLIDTNAISPQVALGIVLVGLGAITIYTLWRIRTQENRQQWLLSALMVCLLGTNGLLGLFSVPRETEADRQLAQFWRDLRDWKTSDQLTSQQLREIHFVSEQDLPAALRYTGSALWPTVPHVSKTAWDAAALRNGGPGIQRLVIVWGRSDAFRAGISADQLTLRPLATARLFRGKQLQAILVGS